APQGTAGGADVGTSRGRIPSDDRNGRLSRLADRCGSDHAGPRSCGLRCAGRPGTGNDVAGLEELCEPGIESAFWEAAVVGRWRVEATAEDGGRLDYGRAVCPRSAGGT